jgi:hypothetical protein
MAWSASNKLSPKDLKMHQVHNYLTSNATMAMAVTKNIQDDAYGKALGLGGLPPAVGPPQVPRGYSLIVHSRMHDIRVKWASLDSSGCLPASVIPFAAAAAVAAARASGRRLDALPPSPPMLPLLPPPYRAPVGVAPPATLEPRLNRVATFIMGTASAKNPWFNWYTRIVPTLRTWASAFQYLFVVLPNTPETVAFLTKHGCSPVHVEGPHNNTGWAHEYACQAYAYAHQSHEARVVLTATPKFDCTDEYHGDGPCCKANFALWYMLTVRRPLFETLNWVGFIDDDVYVQPKVKDCVCSFLLLKAFASTFCSPCPCIELMVGVCRYAGDGQCVDASGHHSRG